MGAPQIMGCALIVCMLNNVLIDWFKWFFTIFVEEPPKGT